MALIILDLRHLEIKSLSNLILSYFYVYVYFQQR